MHVWLCAWDGAAEDGKAWADSWEPTANVSEDLRQDFFQERIESASRVKVAVDVTPLNTMVQRRMSVQAMKEQGELMTSFGAVHIVPIEELSLKDLAEYYITTMSARYKVQVDESFDPKTKVTTKGLRLKVNEAGKFCSFEMLPSTKLTGKRIESARARRMSEIWDRVCRLRVGHGHRLRACAYSNAVLTFPNYLLSLVSYRFAR